MRTRTTQGLWATAFAIVAASAHAQEASSSGAAVWLAVVPDVLCAAAALAAVTTGVALTWHAFNGDSPEGFGLRRHAGGFGGPGVGWRISTPVARLIAGLALVALGAVIALARVPVAGSHAAAPANEGVPSAPHAKAVASAASVYAAPAEPPAASK